MARESPASPRNFNCWPSRGGACGSLAHPFRKERPRLLLSCSGCAASATAGRRLPAVVGGAVLVEAGILADRISLREASVGIAEDLARLEGRIANVDEHLLVARIILRESGKTAQVVISENDYIDAGGSGDIVSIGHAHRCFNHHDHEHVVVDGLPVVDPIDSPDASSLP